MARKLRKMDRAAKTKKGSHVVLAPKDNVPVEIASKPSACSKARACDKPIACTSNPKPSEKKPSEKKPSASKCKAATTAPKQAFKVSLGEYKAQVPDKEKEEENARVYGSWANVVSRAKSDTTNQGWVKAEAHLSTVVDAIKPFPSSQKRTLDEASWPSLGGSVPRTRRSLPKKDVVKKETAAALSESDSDQRIKAILAKEPSQAVPSKTVDPASCHDPVSPQVTTDKQTAVVDLSESESDQRIKAVVAKEPCSSAVQEKTVDPASCQAPVPPQALKGKAAVQATDMSGSRRGFVSADGRPISRKWARKAKRVAVRSAKADKESHAEPASGKAKATQEVVSKPPLAANEPSVSKPSDNKPSDNKLKENKPPAGSCKAAPVPKQSYKVNLTQYKATATTVAPESGLVGASWSKVVSTAQQVTIKKTGCTKGEEEQSTVVGAKPSSKVQKVALDDSSWPSLGSATGSDSCVANVVTDEAASRDQASREEDRVEEEEFIPVPRKRTFSLKMKELRKKKIYKNNMTKEEYLDWLDRQIFEEGMLDSVSTNWCLMQLD
jgi:hypothetical protein